LFSSSKHFHTPNAHRRVHKSPQYVHLLSHFSIHELFILEPTQFSATYLHIYEYAVSFLQVSQSDISIYCPTRVSYQARHTVLHSVAPKTAYEGTAFKRYDF
jgi:hypothetical protein